MYCSNNANTAYTANSRSRQQSTQMIWLNLSASEKTKKQNNRNNNNNNDNKTAKQSRMTALTWLNLKCFTYTVPFCFISLYFDCLARTLSVSGSCSIIHGLQRRQRRATRLYKIVRNVNKFTSRWPDSTMKMRTHKNIHHHHHHYDHGLFKLRIKRRHKHKSNV